MDKLLQEITFIAKGDGHGRFIVSIDHGGNRFNYPEPMDFKTMMENLEWARVTLGLREEQALIDPFAIKEAAKVDLAARQAMKKIGGRIACLPR